LKSETPDKSPAHSQDMTASDTGWDPEAVLEEALREREKLLSSHPDLAELQAEVDRRLARVDSFEDRMAILGKMIGHRLNRLSDTCEELEALCHDVGIHTELPITRFKKTLSRNRLLITNDDE
jgi:predicted nuclease with TOPRIM domain